MKILILANNDIGLYQFRRELIEELLKKNKVVIALPYGELIEPLKKMGCRFINTPVDRRGINPFKDLKLMLKYMALLKAEAPELVITYTIKPNIYGGMACRIRKIPYAVNITGLGTAFQKKGFLRKLVVTLYKQGLKKANLIFFENIENRQIFVDQGIAEEKDTCVLNGAGVNLKHYQVAEYPTEERGIRFLFIGRVMQEKGIEELFSAMQMLQKDAIDCTLDVLGDYEEDYKGKEPGHGLQQTADVFNPHSLVCGNERIGHPGQTEHRDHGRDTGAHDGAAHGVGKFRTADNKDQACSHEHTDLKEHTHVDHFAAVGGTHFREDTGNDDAGHAKDEQSGRKTSFLRKGRTFSRAHNSLHETGLQASLVFFVVLQIFTVAKHDGGNYDNGDQRCGNRHHQNGLKTEVVTVLGVQTDQSSRTGGHRACHQGLLSGNAGSGHRAFRADAHAVSYFIDHRHQGLGDVGCAGHESKEPRHQRRNVNDAVRIGENDFFCDSHHVVDAACGVHYGSGGSHGDHDEKHVSRG